MSAAELNSGCSGPSAVGRARAGGAVPLDSDVILRVEGLTKRFGSLTAVDDLSLQVGRGEILGLLGPNGAGKTTAISMICGLLRPDAGSVRLDGTEKEEGGGARRGHRRGAQRTRVGVCPQETVLWTKLTCLEQLEFLGRMYDMPRREARERGLKLLDALGLADKAGVLAQRLSGGMKRRLNLAMAVLHEPDLVVLDEPEAGLDPQSRVLAREFIRSLASRHAVILTTHNMDEADRAADRVAIMDHGRLLVEDTPTALKRTVGEGDVLEIELSDGGDGTVGERPAGAAVDRSGLAGHALAALAPLQGRAQFQVAQELLTVRARDAAGLLADVVVALRDAGVPCRDVRLREHTLEDVFIHLTGRRLRE